MRPEGSTRARILTINVQNTEGDERRQGVLRAGIERLDPDLVSIQEVVERSDCHQLEDLIEGTKLQGTHQAATLAYEPKWVDRYGGTAIASRWPYRVIETLDLRGADATDVPWCSLAAVVDIPDAGEILFVSTTASWRPDAALSRERQALAVSDLDSRHRRELPTIIAGDFNADPEAASIRYLTGRQSLDGSAVCYLDSWELAGDGPGYTWSAQNTNAQAVMDQIVGQADRDHRFDYVFVGSTLNYPHGYCHVRATSLAFDQPVEGIWASDHFGVVVDVEIGRNRPPLNTANKATRADDARQPQIHSGGNVT